MARSEPKVHPLQPLRNPLDFSAGPRREGGFLDRVSNEMHTPLLNHRSPLHFQSIGDGNCCGLRIDLERTLAAKILLASSESSNVVINAAVIGSEGEIPSRNLSSIRIMAARRMGARPKTDQRS